MTTTRPTIILSLGRPSRLPVGAIAIDLKHNCFWRGVQRRPKRAGPGFPPIYHGATFRVIAILMMRSPAPVPINDIIDYVWGDDPNGGPENGGNYCRKYIEIHKRRGLLEWLGCEIKNSRSHGYRLEFITNPPLQADLSNSATTVAEIQV